MSAEIVPENAPLAPPTTYEEWLCCFDLLKTGASADNGLVAAIGQGTLTTGGYIAAQFHQTLAETINVMLNNRIARFLKDLNMLISFNELLDIVPLFIRLRIEVRKCLFFTGLAFLDRDIKAELERSIREQMAGFWNDTVSFLGRQTIENNNSELEDALFLIHRIELFTEAV